MSHYDKLGTKGPTTIGKRDMVLGGKSPEGIRMSLLLLNDIMIKIQGKKCVDKDRGGKIHFLSQGRQQRIIRAMEKTVHVIKDARLVFNYEVILY
jgi:hypothetical protein